MANVYRTLQDVSIPRVVAHIQGEGDEAQYETTGENYPAGSFIRAENMTPRDRKRAEDGDLDHLLEPLSDEEAEQVEGFGDHESTVGLFIPEHEAERHALREAGHYTVSKEQELDLMSGGASFAREYQQAASDHGLDQRPVQAALAEPEQPIPTEILTGSETRTGLPHNPGPQEEASDGGEGSEQPSGEAPATRPRPGTEQPAQEQPQSEPEHQGEISSSDGEGQ